MRRRIISTNRTTSAMIWPDGSYRPACHPPGSDGYDLCGFPVPDQVAWSKTWLSGRFPILLAVLVPDPILVDSWMAGDGANLPGCTPAIWPAGVAGFAFARHSPAAGLRLRLPAGRETGQFAGHSALRVDRPGKR